MTTYSVRCRNSACRHRRVARVHPDEAKLTKRCESCNQVAGWRIENRDYNKRKLCQCNGTGLIDGREWGHNTSHPYCEQNPNGPRNQALARGVAPEDLPLELMGRKMGPDDPCPF